MLAITEMGGMHAVSSTLRSRLERYDSRKNTNIIMHTNKKAELQLLDDQFKIRIREATRTITTMQQIETNAVNDSNNNEMEYHYSTPPPEEEC